jgi:hypothetical protein
MDIDSYLAEVLWQIEFQGIMIDGELYNLVQEYWRSNVSPVAAVAMILQIPADTV